MKVKDNIKQIASKYPKISLLGYKLLKKIWSVKSRFVNYDYPENSGLDNISFEKVLEYNKNRDFGPKKKICYAPFNNLHFNINGDVSGCSFKKDHALGNINKDSIHDIWFGNNAQELRETLSNYNLQKCSSCKSVFESGNYRSFPATKYDYFASDDNIYPTQMSFETSNLCNLECVMCDEELSSSIRKNKTKLPPLKNMYSSDFVQQLKEFIPHLSIATFIGGEPLLIKQYYQIWDEIIKSNPSCKIHLQTNATYLPERFLKLLESRQFEVGISMEGCTKETYEAIRLKGNFDSVEKNIHKLVQLKQKGIVYLNFNFCPLTLNWKEIPKMVIYANKFDISLKLLSVNTPSNLALSNRDSIYLTNVFNYLESFKFMENNLSFIASRNIENYKFFIKNVSFFISMAQKRDAYFAQESQKSLEELKHLFEFEFINNKVIAYFSQEQKKTLYDNLIIYILSKSENEKLLKNIINRYRYITNQVKNEKFIERSLSKSISITRQLIDEYYIMENENMEASV